MRNEHRKIERTEADRARLAAVREKFKHRPSARELEAGGEYGPPVPGPTFWGLMALAKELRAAREATGLSLDELAARTGIDKAALSRLETGKNGNPTVDTLARYAAALGKRLVWSLADVTAPAATDAG